MLESTLSCMIFFFILNTHKLHGHVLIIDDPVLIVSALVTLHRLIRLN